MLASVVLVSLQSARDKGRVASAVMFSTSMYRGWGADAFGVWNFDEPNNGDNAIDSGPNSINLTKAADASVRSSVSPMSSGKSVNFTGSGVADLPSFVSADVSTKSINMSKYTASVWVYMDDTTSSKGTIFSVYSSAPGRAGFMNFSTIDTVPFTLYAGPQLTGCAGNTYFSYKPSIKKWTHYSFSWDGSIGSVRLYVDGKFHSALTGCTTLIGAGSWIAQYIYVGNHANGGSHFVKGSIDELAIYPNVLTSDAIQQIYAEGVKRHNLALNTEVKPQ